MIHTSVYQNVAALSDLPPGERLRVRAHDAWILIANVDGACHAVADTCTHEDASLYLGALVGDCVRCPLHGSLFCLRDGRALDEPADTDLAVYPVRIEDDRILVARPSLPNPG